MTKKDYLDSLSNELGTMSYNDVKEIIAEIEEHFAQGIIAGKSEEDIAEGLGSPKELAAAYLEGNETKIRTALKKMKQEEPSRESTPKWNNGPLFVVLFNLFLAIPLWIVLFIILLSGIAIDAGVIFVLISLAMAIPASGAFIPGLIVLDVSILFFAIFLTFLLILLIKYFFQGTGRYINWNRDVWDHGF
ncbi:Uncharacterized membrane protein [Ruminococcaceae bacterium YRB3002]|nr:Uncharacterized membrane protein [Ruminococcaceae bacterium YRB3002]